MTTFALVHGAWGSGWHWASIPERLRAAGHAVVAPDLPCNDPRARFSDYADVVVGALEDAGDVVVAGFSLGASTAAMVAARVGARRLVYVAGVVPSPGLSLADQMRRGDVLFLPEYLEGVEVLEGGAGSRWVDVGVYRRVAYDELVPEDIVRERFARLRPQMNAPFLETFPGPLPDVPTDSILCTGDRLLNNDLWRTRSQVTHEIESAHQLMASQPERLTEILLRST